MCEIIDGLIVKRQNCIDDIEARFKEVTGIRADLSRFPIEDRDGVRQKTEKGDIDKYGFVTTPINVVDQMVVSMIEKTAGCSYAEILAKPIPERRRLLWQNDGYIDLCCGCGQFGIRILRAFANMAIDSRGKQNTNQFHTSEFLYGNLAFAELNPESVAKVIYVFGGVLTLMIGDASNVNLRGNPQGLLFYREGMWQRHGEFTASVHGILQSGMAWKGKVKAIAEEVRRNVNEDGSFIERVELPFGE